MTQRPHRPALPPGTELSADDDTLTSVTVLLDPDDDAHLTHTLLEIHDPASAVVTLHPTHGISSAATLAHDLLLTLGHSLDRAGAEGATGPDSAWRAVTAWVRGDGIRHLIVLRAHHLSPEQHARLLRLRHDTGVHLVLVWHSRDPLISHLEMPAGVRLHITDDLASLIGRLAPPHRDTPTPADTAELPAVPGSDAAVFLTDAAAALPHADYTRVAAVYHQAAEMTDRRLTRCGTAPDLPQRMLAYLPAPRTHLRTLYGTIPLRRIRRWHTAVGLYRFLGDLVADSPGRNHTLARLRGAQAAFEQHGLPLTLPPNLAHMVGPGLSTIAITDRVVTAIRAHAANPAHAAALATLLFTGATFEELRSLPLTRADRGHLDHRRRIRCCTPHRPAPLGDPPAGTTVAARRRHLPTNAHQPHRHTVHRGSREDRQAAAHRSHVRVDDPGPAPVARWLALPDRHPQPRPGRSLTPGVGAPLSSSHSAETGRTWEATKTNPSTRPLDRCHSKSTCCPGSSARKPGTSTSLKCTQQPPGVSAHSRTPHPSSRCHKRTTPREVICRACLYSLIRRMKSCNTDQTPGGRGSRSPEALLPRTRNQTPLARKAQVGAHSGSGSDGTSLTSSGKTH
ncbi:hypothetical protein EV641_12364 [Rhodococcus sp. SMB37]|nr:hypothetical protein EV641_12364 [Rhodococcus sp. SMB37]